jgi:hypothetical protein
MISKRSSRMIAGTVLAAGLALTGATSASASTATGSGGSTSAPAPGSHRSCVIVHKVGSAPGGKKIAVKIVDGKYYVNGKQVPKSKVPGGVTCPVLPGKGKHTCIVIVHKGGATGGTTTGSASGTTGGTTTSAAHASTKATTQSKVVTTGGGQTTGKLPGKGTCLRVGL